MTVQVSLSHAQEAVIIHIYKLSCIYKTAKFIPYRSHAYMSRFETSAVQSLQHLTVPKYLPGISAMRTDASSGLISPVCGEDRFGGRHCPVLVVGLPGRRELRGGPDPPPRQAVDRTEPRRIA